MANPFNSVPFAPVAQPSSQNNFTQIVQQAKQDPRAFEENLKRTNPAAYQQALQIRNSPNPQALIMQMAQARGISPDILRMLGIS